MKIILDTEPRTQTITLTDVPVGACVRAATAPLGSGIIYMRTNSESWRSDAMVRLNDGYFCSMDDLEGTTWELADAEVVVHSK